MTLVRASHAATISQILLEPAQHAELAAIASREQRSLSDLVREMLRLQLEERRNRMLAAAAKNAG